MESNSEDSFAWTDASDDTSDSEIRNNSVSMPSADDSESGRSYKNNLQNKLFSNYDQNVHSQSKRKRKLSNKYNTVENGASPSKKRIKIEPESDFDSKKDCKAFINERLENTNDSYEESYLNEKVKYEQNIISSSVKAKKKAEKRAAIEIYNSTDNNTQDECGDLVTQDSSRSQLNPSRHTERGTKKKKSKVKHSNSTIIEDSFPTTGNNGSPGYSVDVVQTTLLSDASSPPALRDAPGGPHTPPHAPHTLHTTNHHSLTSTHTSDGESNQQRKLSDRITFEGEYDSKGMTSLNSDAKTKLKATAKLQRFIEKSNILCRSVDDEQSAAENLTDDDDLWLVRCSKDINLYAFNDKNWTLDNKCKIKLDNCTYEGSLEENNMNVSIVASDHKRVFIRSATIRGSVRLQRRIPKAAGAGVAADALATPPGALAAPPATRLRHPLLGAHYRRALRPPPPVARRLADAAAPATAPGPGPAPGRAPSPVVRKKKKKRKHTDPPEEAAPPRANKRQYDLRAADTWGSEIAIEQTLFNF